MCSCFWSTKSSRPSARYRRRRKVINSTWLILLCDLHIIVGICIVSHRMSGVTSQCCRFFCFGKYCVFLLIWWVMDPTAAKPRVRTSKSLILLRKLEYCSPRCMCVWLSANGNLWTFVWVTYALRYDKLNYWRLLAIFRNFDWFIATLSQKFKISFQQPNHIRFSLSETCIFMFYWQNNCWHDVCLVVSEKKPLSDDVPPEVETVTAFQSRYAIVFRFV